MVNKAKTQFPPQHQNQQPGIESKMTPQPVSEDVQPVLKLKDKVAVITGGDSGIGRAVAVLFAQHGAKIVISYLNEHDDAARTRELVEQHGQPCETIAGDIGSPTFCREIIEHAVKKFGKLDLLINNAGEHTPQTTLEDITPQQLEHTFRTNVFSMFYLTQAALKHMKAGSAIINTASVTAYKGSDHLLDYAASKGAVVSFTRSLAMSLTEREIRVNAVAPGPIWTPLIPSSFSPDEVATFGEDVPMKRAGQPEEVAPSFLFLASDDASYMTGQVLHPNGGTIVNG